MDDDQRVVVVFFFFGWGTQGTPFLGLFLRSMISIGVGPLLLGGTGQLFPPLQGSAGLLLLCRFLVDEIHNVRVTGGRWGVTSPRLTGFGLNFIQKPHPFFTGRFFYAYHV